MEANLKKSRIVCENICNMLITYHNSILNTLKKNEDLEDEFQEELVNLLEGIKLDLFMFQDILIGLNADTELFGDAGLEKKNQIKFRSEMTGEDDEGLFGEGQDSW